jgi:hypothetical protein
MDAATSSPSRAAWLHFS